MLECPNHRVFFAIELTATQTNEQSLVQMLWICLMEKMFKANRVHYHLSP